MIRSFLVSWKTLPLVVYVLFISSPALTRKMLTRERGSRGDHKVFPFLAVRAIVYWPQDWTGWLTRVGILAQHQITGTANCCAILQLPMHIILISAYARFLLSRL